MSYKVLKSNMSSIWRDNFSRLFVNMESKTNGFTVRIWLLGLSKTTLISIVLRKQEVAVFQRNSTPYWYLSLSKSIWSNVITIWHWINIRSIINFINIRSKGWHWFNSWAINTLDLSWSTYRWHGVNRWAINTILLAYIFVGNGH